MVATTQVLTVAAITSHPTTSTAVVLGKDRTLRQGTLYITGTFTGSVTVQVSPDGTEYVSATSVLGVPMAALTAPAVHSLSLDATHIRVTTVSFSSGTATVSVVWGLGAGVAVA